MNILAMCNVTALTDGALSSVGRKYAELIVYRRKGENRDQNDIQGVRRG
jgi:hypothetical protein